MKLPVIKSVKAIVKYQLDVCFDDGTKGIYDISHLAGKGVFKSWDEHDNFYKVAINPESGAITWPGELDVDTLSIYCAIKGIHVEAYLNQPLHAAYQ